MKMIKNILPVMAIGMVLSLAGCGSNNNNAAPVASTNADYSTLVSRLFSETADDTDPLDVNGLDLGLADQDNSDAFQSLL